jgi:pantothenate kinase
VKWTTPSSLLTSRRLHAPIPKSLACKGEKALLWLEGGWLLYPENGWRELIPLYDYSYFISASPENVSQHILNRHV